MAIGRNEGERLKACLRSLPAGVPVVYVDSASTDGSADFARSVGAEVVDLDLSRPFTAARARNEGFERLLAKESQIELVQFIDGDCELEQGWIAAAATHMRAGASLAAVCGRRREKFPQNSFYNAMCDAEWNTPIGLADACGGDALYRVSAFRQVGGFDATLIAHEEPDLCSRLGSAGYRIERLDLPMTRHDADIRKFSQFWRRNIRAGYGYAQATAKHWKSSNNPGRVYCRRALTWSFVLPVLCLGMSVLQWPWGLLSWLIFPMQISRRALRGGLGWRRATFELFHKFAEFEGMLKWLGDMLTRRRRDAVQYKVAS